jgi:hypothetical protein
MIKYFENIGNYYINNYLSLVDIEKMKVNEDYSKKMFFYYWAFERQGAPLGYKIAAIKALADNPNLNLAEAFDRYYMGEKNKKNNPFYDDRINHLKILDVIKNINQRDFQSAFNSINLKGLSHKIRSFFIRDIVFLLGLETNDFNIEQYLYMTPIDIWVRLVVENMMLLEPTLENVNHSEYDIKENDFRTAVKLIKLCRANNISPLNTNMGIWYYCPNIVADQGRLIEIIKQNDVEV